MFSTFLMNMFRPLGVKIYEKRGKQQLFAKKKMQLIPDASLEGVILCVCDAFRHKGDTVFLKPSRKESALIQWLSHHL